MRSREAVNPQPQYANYFEIGHNQLELVLAFGQRYTDEDGWNCHTRIIMTPAYARELLRLLSEALDLQTERDE